MQYLPHMPMTCQIHVVLGFLDANLRYQQAKFLFSEDRTSRAGERLLVELRVQRWYSRCTVPGHW